MNKVTKLGVSALCGSLAAMSSASAGELGVDHAVSLGKLHGNPVTVIADPAGSNCDDLALLGLFLGRIRQVDPPLGRLFLLDWLNYYSLAEWHKVCHVFLLSWFCIIGIYLTRRQIFASYHMELLEPN